MSYTINYLTRNQSTGAITRTDFTQYVVNGFSVVEKLDESLDIGTIVLYGLPDTSSTPLAMFDTIEIKDGSTVLYSMRIAGDNVRMISKNPISYEHTLSLVEHTKILEQYIINGKTFRQPTDGSTLYTLADVIDVLNNTTPLEVIGNLSTTRLFEFGISTDYFSLLDSIESPEFTFKDITFREALTQVAGYVDAIPRLKLNSSDELELTFDFVNELKTLIASESDFLERTAQQDISLHATTIESDVLNLVNDSDLNESVEIYPTKGAYISGRSDKYIFNILDSYAPTPKKIYSIQKFYIKPKQIVVQGLGAYATYDSRNKFDYYADSTYFPTVGIEDIYYVDIDDSEQVYEWTGSAYATVPTTTDGTRPKVRFCSSTSLFPFTSSIWRDNDFFVARDSGFAYRYDGVSTYLKLDYIDEYGDLVLECSNRIFEENIYRIQDVDSKINATDRLDPDKFYQSNTLYYTYRQKNILLGNTTGVWDTTTSIEIVARLQAFYMLQEDGYIGSTEDYDDYFVNFIDSNPYDYFSYQTHYVPVPNSVRLSIDREDNSDVEYNSTIISNQQSRIVNFENFTNNLYGRVNRIGNSELQLSNREVSSTDLYNIGDYTDDLYIITEKEIVFFRDYVYANYSLSKNYNMISKFIGVNSEIRQYEIAEQDTLDRKIVYSEYIEVDIDTSGTGSDTSKFDNGTFITGFMDTFLVSSQLEPIRGAIFDSSETTNNLICDISSNGGGNSLVFDWQFPSNQFVAENIDNINSQRARNFVSYVNSSGRMTSFKLYFYNKLITDGFNPDLNLELADNYPITDLDFIHTEYLSNSSGNNFYTLKDSAEIIGGTIAFKIKPVDVNKVIIGRWLSRRNRLVNENPPTSIKLYYSTSEKLGRTDTFDIPSTYTNYGTVSPTLSYTNKTITINEISSVWTSWALTDENGKVLIGCNQDNEQLDTITFDFLNKASDIKYKY